MASTLRTSIVKNFKLYAYEFWFLEKSGLINCDSCVRNKSHKLPFFYSSLKSTRPLEILFSDVWVVHQQILHMVFIII